MIVKDKPRKIFTFLVVFLGVISSMFFEVGYVLGSKYQGFGYMTEALKGMFIYAKNNNLASNKQLMNSYFLPYKM